MASAAFEPYVDADSMAHIMQNIQQVIAQNPHGMDLPARDIPRGHLDMAMDTRVYPGREVPGSAAGGGYMHDYIHDADAAAHYRSTASGKIDWMDELLFLVQWGILIWLCHVVFQHMGGMTWAPHVFPWLFVRPPELDTWTPDLGGLPPTHSLASAGVAVLVVVLGGLYFAMRWIHAGIAFRAPSF